MFKRWYITTLVQWHFNVDDQNWTFQLTWKPYKFLERFYKMKILKEKLSIDLISNVMDNEWLIYELVLNDQMSFKCITTIHFLYYCHVYIWSKLIKFHENMIWSMNVYSCVETIFVFFFFWIILFHLISLQFYTLKYNIISFTIFKYHFLNFELE